MKVTPESVFDVLLRLRDYFLGNNVVRHNDEPFRSELYSSEQMTNHGKVVAQSHKISKRKYPNQLLKRLHENEVALLEVRNLLVEDIKAGKAITPAAEWLLDNFYLIEEQVVIARKHLPKGYNDSLPFLEDGPSSGIPRVYDIVLEIISHSDGRVDVKNLSSFVSSYQSLSVLTLGELWAIPIMLRLAVIENLRRVSGKIALGIIDHNLADYWADKMMATIETDSTNLILTIADMARSKPVLDSAFVAGFTRKLQGKGPALALPLTWVEQQLAVMGTNSNDLVREDTQMQAADQVSISNSITTLRFIGATDWREFVETLSVVEQTLRKDHMGTYGHMDFATRDRYRHIVESISKRSALSEKEVAEKVLELAGKHEREDGHSERARHIGYYLIDKGLKQTHAAAAVSYTTKQRLRHIAKKMPLFFYLSSIILLTVAIASGLAYFASAYGDYSTGMSVIIALIFVSCAAHLAVSLTNWLSTLWVKPVLLPRMDFSGGIPTECRTLVAIPTMLLNKTYIEELVEALEIRFLANREENVHFCLLTDFADADAETLPEDEELLAFAANAIAELNTKYVQSEYDTFFLFHRPRKWNEQEKKWMGYERKRGKLAALNALLRGHERNEFSRIVGKYAVLNNVKYVLTLDSDTRIPREAIWKLVATMAHPLNHAVYNPEQKRVTDGYGILQPRIASGIPTSGTSLYLRVQGDVSGIDPYTKASSDVYQDLFGEGSFIGKGIYDVDIFERAVANVFQENRILSHDLLEGCYARAGLVSDVLLYEDNPSQYSSDIRRHHRWIRGDWQIGAWMLPFVTDGELKLKPNKLSTLSRWKIFDNLRRSLVPISLVGLLLAGWTVLPFPWFWTLAFTAIVLLTPIVSACLQLARKPGELGLSAHLAEVGKSVKETVVRFIFGVAVLPYEAFKYVDAILRTNWRMIVTRRKLLEWAPSATYARTGNNIFSIYASLWIAPVSALAIGLWLSQTDVAALLVASPILILWLAAPALVWLLNAPDKDEELALPEEQALFLHKTARKTWAFFEQFVTAEENWLPPDNFQEHPVSVIAHRTSPTNMGLALLANLSAYDFGYIAAGTMIQKCNDTLQSMYKLERYKGHFYNWYDTVSLQPLNPRYVSAVDSGNLTGHLLTLKQGLLDIPKQPIVPARIFEGLRITAEVVGDFSKDYNKVIGERVLPLLSIATTGVSSLPAISRQLDELRLVADELNNSPEENIEAVNWAKRFSQQISDISDDLALVAPWGNLQPRPARFEKLGPLEGVPSLLLAQGLPEIYKAIILDYEQQDNSIEENEWLSALRAALQNGAMHATERIALLEQMAHTCEELSDIAYDFLFDKATSLLKIGYNVDEQRKDNSSYDLLASEARLGVFVGIAQGKLPQDSWFALGRLLTNSGGDPILLSWSGSMFEYLMPQLVMPSYENTLLYQTNKATVKRQIEYAAQRGVPWGISESAFNTFDVNLNYQYRAFGVPGLGLKRGLEEDLVIAPYASMLALMVSPSKACANLQLLSKERFEGEYGFYEAIDYTAGRIPRDQSHSVIKSYMVHHQGMGLLSLSYLLLDKPMQRRFVSELRFQATLLLLQERIPRATIFYAHTADIIETSVATADAQIRSISTANTITPEIQLLGNGSYQVMVTNSGGGYSRWKDMAVTRWREDATKDNTGIFCYIKDVKSGNFWSNTYQPTLKTSKEYEAIFSQGHVEFRRKDYGIDTKTEIVISPEDDTEMRRMRLTNRTQTERVLEITSYAEVVMASQASDEAHPAFSNLFVETEILLEYKAIYCTRRPRSAGEVPPWMFHLMSVQGTVADEVSYETDRMQFTGRGRDLVHPQAMDTSALSGRQGAVLDPIVAIRYRITIKPYQTVTVDMIYGMSATREACDHLMHKYSDTHLKRRAFELSWTHSQVLMRQINATEADTLLYDRLAAAVIYANPNLRGGAASIQNNLRGQSGLWAHSVSGDLPIILLHIHDTESLEIARQLVQAHAYWRLKGLSVDLMIWNEDHGSYRQLLQEQILGLITTEIGGAATHDRPGKIFIKSADQISTEDRLLFESVARVVIHDNKGTLSEQVNGYVAEATLPPIMDVKQAAIENITGDEMSLPTDLLFFNGFGGFTEDGKEYKIITDRGSTTPAPWVNVIANPDFGTVISENGSAYTWAINAHEYRLTPWSNDPVSDAGGEAFYLRDEETGHFWSPSPFPAAGDSPYITTHGFGYTRFEHNEAGIATELCTYVDKDSPVKFVVIKLKNNSGRERKVSATGFLETILGDLRSKTNMHVISDYDGDTGALLMRNRYNLPFAERVTFFRVSDPNQLSFTADRAEFIGRNGNLSDPKALYRKKLSGRRSAGMDACAALQVKFDLPNGAEKEIIFQIGNGRDISDAKALLQKFADKDVVATSLQEVKAYWEDMLGTVQVTTPDSALNTLTNGWLAYQTLACRIFARSGFYQSGGAFGFRDQLQDVLALLHTRPDITKAQILLCASRQFAEGDVQHWWHPPEGRGVRTRCSDDLLWLPFALCRYVAATGDTNILNTPVPFLEGNLLRPDQDSLYDLPNISSETASLYEHCARAIKHSLQFGSHGLPLIGSGDWNDGMDRVGDKGSGESIWLGFFLYDILMDFTHVADGHGDTDFALTCKQQADTLQANLEKSGWDGEWYRRAYFDDGTPLGTKESEECKIDAIVQSWSILSGAGSDERKEMAMAALDKHLVKRDVGLIQLLDPPFDKSTQNPGYIRGYVPGVRENGGQYSHAAIWALMAFAKMGRRDKTWELFSMIHPISHTADAQRVQTYKAEPYVMAADVYNNDSHRGRGGWTWYTGSSGWMYQFILSSMLGIERVADQLKFKPCFPLEWPFITIRYRYKNATYDIKVSQVADSVSRWKVGSEEGLGDTITLTHETGVHTAEVNIKV